MERGSDWERLAVQHQWRELERERRTATRLGAGLALVLSGVVGLLLGLTTEACVIVGPVPQGCTMVVAKPTQIGLLLFATAGIVGGAWLAWTAFAPGPRRRDSRLHL